MGFSITATYPSWNLVTFHPTCRIFHSLVYSCVAAVGLHPFPAVSGLCCLFRVACASVHLVIRLWFHHGTSRFFLDPTYHCPPSSLLPSSTILSRLQPLFGVLPRVFDSFKCMEAIYDSRLELMYRNHYYRPLLVPFYMLTEFCSERHSFRQSSFALSDCVPHKHPLFTGGCLGGFALALACEPQHMRTVDRYVCLSPRRVCGTPCDFLKYACLNS